MAADGFHVQDVTVVIPAGEFFRYDLPKEVIPAIGYNQKGRLITMRILIKYIIMCLVYRSFVPFLVLRSFYPVSGIEIVLSCFWY